MQVKPERRFTNQNRLRKSKDFATVFNKGLTIVTPALVFRALPSDCQMSRLGLAITKKVGGSVERNLIKRRIREAFRLEKASFRRSFDIVVSARKGVLEKKFPEYQRSFQMLIVRLHKWPNGSANQGIG